MVYKIGCMSDLNTLPWVTDTALELLHHQASVLSYLYGEERNIEESDGGFVLYATPGTKAEDIKDFFDISKHTVEYVNVYGSLCEAVFVLNNESVVTIIMSVEDAPAEILNEI